MSSIDIGSFFTLYGDLVQLNFAPLQVENLSKFNSHWHHYNPRKPENARLGLSITSLDGKLSGVPDLDSLKEYNKINKTDYREKDFNQLTEVTKSIDGLAQVLNQFDSIGRSHFIKLNKGGHFPPHRDGGTIWPPTSIRVFSPIQNCDSSQFVWLQDGKQLPMKQGAWYVINTSREHSVFSFSDECIFMVFNIPVTQKNMEFLLSHLMIS